MEGVAHRWFYEKMLVLIIYPSQVFFRVMAGYVEKAAKRLFGIPDFKYYALADGLRSLFMRHPGRPARVKRYPRDAQLYLFVLDGT